MTHWTTATLTGPSLNYTLICWVCIDFSSMRTGYKGEGGGREGWLPHPTEWHAVRKWSQWHRQVEGVRGQEQDKKVSMSRTSKKTLQWQKTCLPPAERQLLSSERSVAIQRRSSEIKTRLECFCRIAPFNRTADLVTTPSSGTSRSHARKPGLWTSLASTEAIGCVAVDSQHDDPWKFESG